MLLKPAFCRREAFLTPTRLTKFFLLVSCISFIFYHWIRLFNRPNPPITKNLIREALPNISQDLRYSDVYRDHLPKTLKYLLFWNNKGYAPFYVFGTGQKEFLKHKCPADNCYVTENRKFFGSNLIKFDAIAFDGTVLNPHDLPNTRSAHQKYIFMTLESADYYPVCMRTFDGFFNWTSTYRLDSDIPYPYIHIYDNQGNLVGPKPNMKWVDMQEVDDKLSDRLINKSRAAAWFVSHCKTRNFRMEYIAKLQQALAKYRYTVDVYGGCGNLKCPRRQQICNELLSRHYYFYMSLENSFAEDYVTEKVFTALKYDAVPIVYGGADYSRFLPPGSYINGRHYKPEELADLMNKIIHSPKTYIDFFKWKHHYKYSRISRIVCAICEALNNKTMVNKVSVHEHFREWWYSDYKTDERC